MWVVSEDRFEWSSITHICVSKETALKRWEEVRDKLIKENEEMIEYCKKEGYKDEYIWQGYNKELQTLEPGDPCDCDSPGLTEWVVEP